MQKQKLTLQRKIENSVQRDGIQLDEAVHNIVSSVSSGEESKFEKDSVMHLLWQQQQKANSMTNKRSMRWHPVIIRWCLSIYLKSPGILKFPFLFDYITSFTLSTFFLYFYLTSNSVFRQRNKIYTLI